MHKMKIAASQKIKDMLQVEREVVDLVTADLTEVSAVVISLDDYRNG